MWCVWVFVGASPDGAAPPLLLPILRPGLSGGRCHEAVAAGGKRHTLHEGGWGQEHGLGVRMGIKMLRVCMCNTCIGSTASLAGGGALVKSITACVQPVLWPPPTLLAPPLPSSGRARGPGHQGCHPQPEVARHPGHGSRAGGVPTEVGLQGAAAPLHHCTTACAWSMEHRCAASASAVPNAAGPAAAGVCVACGV